MPGRHSVYNSLAAVAEGDPEALAAAHACLEEVLPIVLPWVVERPDRAQQVVDAVQRYAWCCDRLGASRSPLVLAGLAALVEESEE